MSESDSGFKAGMPEYLIRHTTFRQMQIFESIVRLRSFTRAAEELFLTQPTVSTQLKKLTNVMDIPLLDQSGRQLKATKAGEELYRAICQIFDSLSDLDSRIAGLKGMHQGRLHLGVITTAKYFAPEILGDFSREYPGIDISLKVCNRERIFERIANNEDDVYILGQPPKKELNLQTYPFAPNPLVVLAARTHPLYSESNISLERLAQEPLISREVGSGIRNTTMRLFHEQGLEANVRMELGSNEAIKHTVLAGLGVAVLSLHTLSLEGANGPVGLLDVVGFPIERKWYLAHTKDKKLSLIAKEFLEFAKKSGPVISERMKKLREDFAKQRSNMRKADNDNV